MNFITPAIMDKLRYAASLAGFIGILVLMAIMLFYAISREELSGFLLYFDIFIGMLLISAAKLYEYGFGYWYSQKRGFSLTYKLQYICKVARVIYGYIFLIVLVAYLVSYLIGY